MRETRSPAASSVPVSLRVRVRHVASLAIPLLLAVALIAALPTAAGATYIRWLGKLNADGSLAMSKTYDSGGSPAS